MTNLKDSTKLVNHMNKPQVRRMLVATLALIATMSVGLSLLASTGDQKTIEDKTAVFQAASPLDEADVYMDDDCRNNEIGMGEKGSGLMIAPVEEAERFNSEWYQWYKSMNGESQPDQAVGD